MFGTPDLPQNDLERAALVKAMVEGNGIATPNAAVPGDASPLNIQDLQQTLANATFLATDCPFFKMLQPQTYIARSPTVQYDLVTSYGTGPSIWQSEVALPDEQDSTYVRKILTTAMMGTTARISFRANAATNIANISLRAQETQNKIALMTAQIENALFNGNRSLVPQQFDGLEKQIADNAPENLIDRRGATLNLSFVNQLCRIAKAPPNYGQITDIFCSPGVFADTLNEPTAASTAGVLRLPNGEADVAFGTSITRYMTQFGVVRLIPDVFIQPGQPPAVAGLGTVGRIPAAPSLTGAITTPVTAGSQFAAPDAGTYIYRIAALNQYGFSPVLTTGGVVVAAGDGVLIPVAAGDTVTTAYVVYRSALDEDASTCREAFRVAKTGASQTITDLNAYIPGTSKAYFLSMQQISPRDGAPNLQWAQLTPMTQFDLATVDTSIRWMIYADAGLIVRVPKRHLVAYNIVESGVSLPTGNSFV